MSIDTVNFPLPTAWILAALYGLSALVTPALAQVRITEWMADNGRTLADEDGNYPDWIELQNIGGSVMDLAGWQIQSRSGPATPWRFGATNLPPGGRLVVFASGKNRSTPGLPFHTDFTLQSEGDRILLKQPDGVTVTSDVAFGPQWKDRSQGTAFELRSAPWVPLNAPGRWRLPTDGPEATTWQGGAEPFDDAAWSPCVTGIGFDASDTGVVGLMAYWDFNDASNATRVPDRSGGGHTGNLTRATYSAPGTGATGRPLDRALTVTGNGVMTVPHAVSGAFDAAVAANAITISLWVNGGAQQPAPQMLFWAGSSSDGGGVRSLNVHLPWSDSVIYWDTGCCDPALQRVSVSEPDSTKWKGRWNHYAFIKQGNIKQIWQNGKLLLEGTNTDPLATIRSFFLGAMTATGASGYDGMIDEVSLWSTALRPPEIQALAAGAAATDLHTLPPYFSTDLLEPMRSHSASAWLRLPFDVPDPEETPQLILRTRYNDGFVAYLNGIEVARRNAPDTLGIDSVATVARSTGDSIVAEEIEFSAAGRLRAGRNILAVHALNRAASDPTFLFQPELLGGRLTADRYFTVPTPGAPNGAGVDGFVDKVDFSRSHGLCWEPFDLVLRCATPGASIVYTLNGSEPTLQNGIQTGTNGVSLTVTTTTTLRAAAFRAGYSPAATVTRTYLFPTAVAAQKRPAGVGTTWPSGHPTDFAVDARVVNGAKPGYEFTNALASIPSISVVADPESLFGPTGIYANSGGHGDTWERTASMEWIQPDGSRGFSEPVGLRIHGGISRDKGFTPKHGFSVVFRSELGVGKLDYPVFPGEKMRGFNRLLLRAGSTDTWPCVEWDQFVNGEKRWYRKDSSYIRDQYVRDLQLALGQASSHGTYAHLYLNGIYWGLYNVCERPDDDFNAMYYGGTKEEYDVLSDFAEVHQGNGDAWNRMMTLASANLADNTAYFRLLGRNRDGTRNPASEVLLDADNLIDYMLLHIWFTADDWPSHNWWAARRRGPVSTGFKFFSWDQEISNNSLVKTHNSYGQVVTEVDNPNTPAYMYARCRLNAEFRLRFADHVQKHLFNNGALTPGAAVALWDRRIAEIDTAVVAESARWGDFQRASKPYLREVEWMTNLLWMRNRYFPTNTTIALRKLRSAGLFPTLAAPMLQPFGGLVAAGTQATLQHTNANGSLYFTLDDSDPRLVGGGLNPTAELATNTVTLTVQSRTRLKARVRNGNVWSPLIDAEFILPQDYTALQPTEIQYHPTAFQGRDGDAFEFLELANTGASVLDLSGLQFTQGIQFTFPSRTLLNPGSVVVLVSNPDAFSERYPGVRYDGVYEGNLSNGGEAITLGHPAGFTVFTVDYDDNPPWPAAADALGQSLQRATLSIGPENPVSWTAGAPTPGIAPDFNTSDSDGDGLPDAWERLHGTNPSVADATADPDGDGLDNLAEFHAGTDPQDPASTVRLDATAVAPDRLRLQFVKEPDRIHVLQRRVGPEGAWEFWRQFEPEAAARSIEAEDTITEVASKWYRLSVRIPVR